MVKRILLALAMAASLGGAVIGCNTPAATAGPTIAAPSSTPALLPSASDVLPSTAPSAVPSAS